MRGQWCLPGDVLVVTADGCPVKVGPRPSYPYVLAAGVGLALVVGVSHGPYAMVLYVGIVGWVHRGYMVDV